MKLRSTWTYETWDVLLTSQKPPVRISYQMSMMLITIRLYCLWSIVVNCGWCGEFRI